MRPRPEIFFWRGATLAPQPEIFSDLALLPAQNWAMQPSNRDNWASPCSNVGGNILEFSACSQKEGSPTACRLANQGSRKPRLKPHPVLARLWVLKPQRLLKPLRTDRYNRLREAPKSQFRRLGNPLFRSCVSETVDSSSIPRVDLPWLYDCLNYRIALSLDATLNCQTFWIRAWTHNYSKS